MATEPLLPHAEGIERIIVTEVTKDTDNIVCTSPQAPEKVEAPRKILASARTVEPKQPVSSRSMGTDAVKKARDMKKVKEVAALHVVQPGPVATEDVYLAIAKGGASIFRLLDQPAFETAESKQKRRPSDLAVELATPSSQATPATTVSSPKPSQKRRLSETAAEFQQAKRACPSKQRCKATEATTDSKNAASKEKASDVKPEQKATEKSVTGSDSDGNPEGEAKAKAKWAGHLVGTGVINVDQAAAIVKAVYVRHSTGVGAVQRRKQQLMAIFRGLKANAALAGWKPEVLARASAESMRSEEQIKRDEALKAMK